MVKISFRTQAPETMVAFSDESCHNAHRFFVLGAIFFAYKKGTDIKAAIQQIEEELKVKKAERGLVGRVKWQKLPSKPGKFLEGYKALVREVLETKNVYFKAMVVDTHKHPLDNKILWGGDQLVGYSKFYCVFLSDGLMSRFKNYFFDFTIDQFEFRPDCDARLLESTAERRFVRKSKPGPYLNHCRITTADHRDSNLLQIVDLLVGAVAFCWNHSERKQSGKEASKLEIVELIKSMTGTDPGKSTGWSEIKFNVWELNPA
jgi:hypothetical protein